MRTFLWLAGLSVGFLCLLGYQKSTSRFLQIESHLDLAQDVATSNQMPLLDLMALAEAFDFPLADPASTRTALAELAGRFAEARVRLGSDCLAVLAVHGRTELVAELIAHQVRTLPVLEPPISNGGAGSATAVESRLQSHPDAVLWRRFISVRQRFAARGHGAG